MKKIINLAMVMVFVAFTASAQSYKVDASKSKLKWNAKKVTGEHFGQITLKNGVFEVKNNKVVSGKFVIDMKSITVEDSEGEWATKLNGHLKSDDFFSVESHPEVVLKIIGSSNLVDGKAKINANLTIKGITKTVEFDAVQEGNNFNATVTVDRTKYDIKYRSGKFFKDIGDKMIYDDFTINVELHANM